MNRLAHYYYLAKPGIIRGNLLTATAGFFFGSRNSVAWSDLTYCLLGLGLVIAAGCVFNNIADRHYDKKMQRTKKRALAYGDIAVRHALMFGAALVAFGSFVLVSQVNLLTAALATAGLLLYMPVYTYAKRLTTHGTLIGSISGGIPPVVGYAAAVNHLDIAALLLFIVLVTWQMPHFYAIAMYRLNDYRAANIPVLPYIKGLRRTQIEIMIYVAAFGVACSLFSILGYNTVWFAVICVGISAYWFGEGIRGFGKSDVLLWGKKMFRISLMVLSVWCVVLSVDSLL